MGQMALEALQTDLLLLIVRCLDARSLYNLSNVSRYLRDLLISNSLWTLWRKFCALLSGTSLESAHIKQLTLYLKRKGEECTAAGWRSLVAAGLEFSSKSVDMILGLEQKDDWNYVFFVQQGRGSSRRVLVASEDKLSQAVWYVPFRTRNRTNKY